MLSTNGLSVLSLTLSFQLTKIIFFNFWGKECYARTVSGNVNSMWAFISLLEIGKEVTYKIISKRTLLFDIGNLIKIYIILKNIHRQFVSKFLLAQILQFLSSKI